MNLKTLPRPRRRFLDLPALALDAPLPLVVTCAGMRLPWPSGYAADDLPDVAAPDEADLFASDDFDKWPTLAQRLADSLKDDRAA